MARSKQIVKSVRLSGAVAEYLKFHDDDRWQDKLRELCSDCLTNYDKARYAPYQEAVRRKMEAFKDSKFGFEAYIRPAPAQFEQLTGLCEALDRDFGRVTHHRLSRALEWLCLVATDSSGTVVCEAPNEPATASLVHAG